MRVLSLFDGMSCGQIALRELGKKFEYYASEIDKHAIKQTQLNFPNTIWLGDVTKWQEWNIDWGFDLVLAGSPCQGFSFAGKQLAFDDPRSRLFFDFVAILNHVRKFNPDVKFLLENVRMKSEHEALITRFVGVNPLYINSALVSAQNRDRLYWTNIGMVHRGLFGEFYPGIPQPEDRGIILRDILQPEIEVDEKYYISQAVLDRMFRKVYSQPKINPDKTGAVTSRNNSGQMGLDSVTTFISVNGKAPAQRASTGRSLDKDHNYQIINIDGNIKYNQDKVGCFTAGGHSGGYHSDMDLVMIQRERGNNNGGIVAKNGKTHSISKSSWEHNNMVMQINPSLESWGKQPYQQNRIYDSNGKSPAVLAEMSCGSNAIMNRTSIRRLTPIEVSRLQTIPSWYKFKFVNLVYVGYICKESNVTLLCQLSAKLTDATEISQAKKPGYATCTTLDLLEQEQRSEKRLTKQKSAKLLDVIEMCKQKNTETFALCTTKELLEMGQRHSQLKLNKNVCVVVSRLPITRGAQKGIAHHTIEVSKFMEIRYSLNLKSKNQILQQDQVDMFHVEMVERNTNRSWSINLEGVSQMERLFITLIITSWIIERKIYTYVSHEANIHLFISNLKDVQSNYLTLDISDLRMECMLPTSDTQIYKMCGNGWTIEVIVWILSHMDK